MRYTKAFIPTVKEVPANTECGVEMANFRDFKEGDIIQSYLVQIIQRKLE